MPFYYYFFLLIMLAIIFLVFRSLFLRKRNISVELFVKALRNENSGHFEEAVINYECALQEVKKIRFHSSLKNKIIEKLKVLHTFIEYKNNVTIKTGLKGNWNETEDKTTTA
ncbi:hypothetical protein FAM09_11400 [Niastella caeni]|uniref:Tetratricopeptide repeat protein n=1 Tax=Niastella caeni TaxID=2569763 RepID=A0A4S8I011_9BACT|nr:hypothetical protein [Niastella caeni]THU40459.1 hypothetical protein FAM09_11400 [Niastella caeni]